MIYSIGDPIKWFIVSEGTFFTKSTSGSAYEEQFIGSWAYYTKEVQQLYKVCIIKKVHKVIKRIKVIQRPKLLAIHEGVCYSCAFIEIKILKSASLFVFLSGEHL